MPDNSAKLLLGTLAIAQQRTMKSNPSRKVSFDSLIACASCDWLHYRTIIEKGSQASCVRCGHELYTRKPFSIDRTLAASLAGVVFLLLSLVLPFLSLSRGGFSSSISVLDAVGSLWMSDMRWLGVLSLALIVLLPLVRLCLLIWVMFRLRYRLEILPSMRSAMRWAQRIEPWAMAEIFMVGVAVSLVKISDLATLTVGLAFWSLLGLVLTTSLISVFFCKDSVWRLLTTHSE